MLKNEEAFSTHEKGSRKN